MNLDGLPTSNTSFPIQESEVKEKEANVKGGTLLPFDIVKNALAFSFETKFSGLELHEKISKVLTDLVNDELSNDDFSIIEKLPEYNQPEFLDSLDRLVKIYEQIKSANAIRDPSLREKQHLSVARNLIEVGDFDKAIELSNKLSDFDYSDLRIDASKALMKDGNFDRAIEIANTLPSSRKKTSLFESISYRLVLERAENIDKAIEVALSMDDAIDGGLLLKGISNIARVVINNNDKANEVAVLARNHLYNAIGDMDVDGLLEGKDSFFYSRIAKAFEEIGDIDKTIKVINKITDPNQQDSLFLSVNENLLKLINTQNIKKATEIANSITNPTLKANELAKIAQILQQATSGG